MERIFRLTKFKPVSAPQGAFGDVDSGGVFECGVGCPPAVFPERVCGDTHIVVWNGRGNGMGRFPPVQVSLDQEVHCADCEPGATLHTDGNGIDGRDDRLCIHKCDICTINQDAAPTACKK